MQGLDHAASEHDGLCGGHHDIEFHYHDPSGGVSALSKWTRLKTWLTQRGVIPRWQLLLVYVMIVGAGIAGFARTSTAIDLNKQALEHANRETAARIHESCIQAKRRYSTAVYSLSRTYVFLEKSSASDKRTLLVRTIRAGLPKQEQDVRGLRPASFCKNIGPPSPTVPRRPASLR